MSLQNMVIGLTIAAMDRASGPLRNVMSSLESVSSKIAAVGAAASGLSLALAPLSGRARDILSQANSAFGSFAESRALIESMPGVSREALDKITADARAFVRQNRVTMGEYYDTVYNVLSGGIPDVLSSYATQVAVRVGQATRGSTADAAAAIVTLFNNFRDTNRDAEEELRRMGDVLTMTQQRFQITNLSQLTDGLKYATAAAQLARLPIEETAAAIGRLNSAGLQGSMAGTAFANVLARLNTASSQLGFAIVRDANTGALDLARTMENLSRVIGDVNRLTPEMQERLRKAFGEEGLRGVTALAQSTQGLRADIEAVRDSAGAFERASEILNRTPNATWTITLNKINDVLIKIGEALNPSLQRLYDMIGRIADRVGAWVERNPELTATLLAIAAAAASVVGGLGGLMVAIAGVTKVAGLLSLALSPVALTVTAVVAAVAAAAYLIYAYWDDIAGAADAAWRTVNNVLSRIERAASSAVAAVSSAVADIRAALRSIVATISGAADDARAAAEEFATRIRERLVELPATLYSIGRDIVAGLIRGMRERIESVAEAASEIASTVRARIRGLLGIQSPSRVFADIGRDIMRGLALGITRESDAPRVAMTAAAAALLTTPPLLAVSPIEALAMPMQETLALKAPERPALKASPIKALEMPALEVPPIEAPDLPALKAPPIEAPEMLMPLLAAPMPQQGTPTDQRLSLHETSVAYTEASPINITINVEGHAAPETARSIASEVERVIERILAERDRRDSINRRARQYDFWGLG